MSKILKVKGRQIFDSRGNPTVEAEVFTKNNSAKAICPSGASTGTYEAFEKRDKYNKKYLGKSVLSGVNSINKNKNIIIIDKGSLDGVHLESGVISPEGAVGIVKNVTNNYASIISLLNTDLKLNAVLQNSSTIGSISWDGINPKILKLNDIPLSSSLKVGDTVITGGMSFYFPKGILIGKIVNYDSNSLEGYYEIDVESFSDFSSLSNLYILNKGDNKEIKSLLNE